MREPHISTPTLWAWYLVMFWTITIIAIFIAEATR